MALSFASVSSSRSGYLGTQTATINTQPFTTAANSLVVLVIEAAEGYIAPWAPPVITDSLTTDLNWKVVAAQADPNVSYGAVWIAWAISPSAQTGMTASVQVGVTDASQTVLAADVTPIVLNGTDLTDPIVNIQKGTSSTASAGATMTPLYDGSYLFMASVRSSNSPTADVPSNGNYLAESYQFGSAYSVAWNGTSAGPAATNGTNKTVSLSTTDTPAVWQYVAFEVAPPHGVVAPGTGIVVGAIAF